MRDLFANGLVGMVGLLLFLGLFTGILVWLFWPGMKDKCKKYGDIPLKD